MALDIPEDLIKRVQISLRREANLASYNPDDTSLPKLPSLQQTLSQLDPSPPYLRCKHCKARLLRGIQSLICVFCGRHHHLDPIPEPLVFRNTFACRWFLDSLDLDGSVRLCFYVSIYVFLFNYNVHRAHCECKHEHGFQIGNGNFKVLLLVFCILFNCLFLYDTHKIINFDSFIYVCMYYSDCRRWGKFYLLNLVFRVIPRYCSFGAVI